MSEKTSNHPTPPPVVRVQGSHRQMGRQIGEAMAAQVRHSIENAHILIKDTENSLELDWEGAVIQARKYIPFAQERYPRYVEEMEGIAEGAGVPFDDLATLTAMEGVTIDALHLTKCTSFAVNDDRTADGHVLVAHNEDWLPEDEPDLFVIHATPDDEPPFVAMTYGGLLPNIGFNACGIAQCCDTVYPNDSRIGVPRIILSRAVLGAKALDEAIRYMLTPQRAAGYNHLLAHESGELYNVEVSARQFDILYGDDGYIAHTNHFLSPNMQAVEYEPDELVATRVRYFRTMRLLRKTNKHSVKSLQAIQRDHVNHPDSICNHAENIGSPLDREKTICTLVMDLTARVMHICWGNACQNPYFTVHL